MTQKDMRGRWHEDDFVRERIPAITAIFEERSFSGPADLQGLSIGFDDSPDLGIHNNLANVEVSNVDLTYATISTSLSESNFRKVTWRESIIDDSVLIHSKFEGCDFGASTINGMLDDALFLQCDFTQAKLRARSLIEQKGGRRPRFEECDFTGAEFRAIVLRAARFINCSFSGARFIKCDLKGTKFEGEAPSRDQFEKCEMPKL